MNDIEINRGEPRKWHQYLAASLAAIGAMCAGTLEGWTSPALPYLQGNYTEGDVISDDEASWIGSLAPLGALVGALPAGFLADMFGRRRVLLMLTVPFAVGWVITVLADRSVCLLYTARIIIGLATGASTVVIPVYNEEISETNVRGELGSYLDISLTLGILYVYAIGAFVPYIWLCIACGVIPILYGATFFWMPESPMYLLSKGKSAEAEKSLRWLRNTQMLDSPTNPTIDAELQDMWSLVKKEDCDNCYVQESSRWAAFKQLISNVSYKSPTFKTVTVVVGLMLLQQLSGINAVIFYTVDIFQDAGSSLSPYYCTLILGVVQVAFTYIAALLVDRLGRRVLLLFSNTVMAISLLVLAVFFFYKEAGFDMHSWTWIPLAALNLYIVSFSLGIGPIPWIMMVELATIETKGWVSSLGVSVNWAMVFVMTKLFVVMSNNLGQAATYGILCLVCVFGSFFVVFCVPETKGKTREEIQNELAGKERKGTEEPVLK
ncbi:facilitated trehalose transporter Tret1-like [Periplaneta americana]|uniref:facilitated trehalose transporter Tret1-like n=1 Tax=Periplaneta americana TaxID=6978 RepID=UPI0037E8B6C9